MSYAALKALILRMRRQNVVEKLVRQMKEDGHLIGVHCMTHKDLTKEPLSDAKKEICETGEKIRAEEEEHGCLHLGRIFFSRYY